MIFTFSIWRLTIEINLFDLDARDRSLAFSISIYW